MEIEVRPFGLDVSVAPLLCGSTDNSDNGSSKDELHEGSILCLQNGNDLTPKKSDPPQVKRLKRKLRNRQSAKRSRLRKKVNDTIQKKTFDNLCIENVKLREKLLKLFEENKSLKDKLGLSKLRTDSNNFEDLHLHETELVEPHTVPKSSFSDGALDFEMVGSINADYDLDFSLPVICQEKSIPFDLADAFPETAAIMKKDQKIDSIINCMRFSNDSHTTKPAVLTEPIPSDMHFIMNSLFLMHCIDHNAVSELQSDKLCKCLNWIRSLQLELQLMMVIYGLARHIAVMKLMTALWSVLKMNTFVEEKNILSSSFRNETTLDCGKIESCRTIIRAEQ